MDDGNIHLIIKTYEKGAFTPYLSRLSIGMSDCLEKDWLGTLLF